MQAQKTIVAFGNFDLEGGRSWVIRTGLAEHGLQVDLCRTEANGIRGKYRDLTERWKMRNVPPDAIYIPFLGHWFLPLAWRLARKSRTRPPIIFDAFLSLYDTEVHDRKRLGAWHPKAWFLWWTDWLCCRLCDVMLLDTEEHAEYFVRTFGVRREKILVLPVGCRTDLFQPKSDQTLTTANDIFRVHFHGTFIPLHGINTILWAAKVLQERGMKDVHFTIVGNGQTEALMRGLARQLELRNITFLPPVPIQNLPTLIHAADVCLGIFGTSDKAGRVIPNKAYEILSCGKPFITSARGASLRVFHQEQDALLVPPGDPHALANAIVRLKDDPVLRRTIAENGRKLSEERFQPVQIVRPLVEWVKARE